MNKCELQYSRNKNEKLQVHVIQNEFEVKPGFMCKRAWVYRAIAIDENGKEIVVPFCVKFSDHETAKKFLKSYNAQKFKIPDYYDDIIKHNDVIMKHLKKIEKRNDDDDMMFG